MENNPVDFYNYTIIGSGASGLWMAYSLYKHGLLADKTLMIVEQDEHKGNDRTWCYWSKDELEPEGLADKSWTYSENNFRDNKSIFPYTYYHIRSESFYKKIKTELSSCKSISWLFTTFQSFQKAEYVSVITKSSTWKTDKLFLSSLSKDENPLTSEVLNAYLNNQETQHIFLWQSFVGWRVKTEKPVFDAKKMTMMNFRIPQSKYIQFLYELPFTSHEALVEVTRFGDAKFTAEEVKPILEHYLNLKHTKFEVEETEIGAIPMTTRFNIKRKYLNKNESVIFLGTLGGAIKPTTGYGFKKMAQYADKLAFAIANQLPLPTQYRRWRFRLYDILLLQILNSEAYRGKEIFETLFKTQPTPKILKFLDEESTLWEELSIFSKLPIFLFLKSLGRYIFK
ncbi:MAG: hypothetical protein IE931_12305 [Sphingobacteriales bacterium]|nr:hypothetical protein [Sphingobacteriales bacterium]